MYYTKVISIFSISIKIHDWLLLYACVDIDLDICTMIIYPSKYSSDLIHLIFILDIIPDLI